MPGSIELPLTVIGAAINLASGAIQYTSRPSRLHRGCAPPAVETRSAAAWAKGAVAYGHLAQLTQPALVEGAIGVVVAPRGKLVRALRFSIANGKITEIEVIGNPARLGELDVSIVE